MSGTPANLPDSFGARPVMAPAASAVCPHCGKRFDEPVALHGGAQRELTAKLSDAQRKILGYLLEGLTEPQIAEKVHRSRHTVHDHTKAIYAAIGVKRRVQLVRLFAGQSIEPAPIADLPPPA